MRQLWFLGICLCLRGCYSLGYSKSLSISQSQQIWRHYFLLFLSEYCLNYTLILVLCWAYNSERMSIRARMIILPLYIFLHHCLTKTSDLIFIICHNVQIQSCCMVVKMSKCSPSWHDTICACTLTCFVPYPLHKFILTSSFYYLWLWHISFLTLYHLLSLDYVRVQLVNLFTFSLCLHNVETFFCTIFSLSPRCILSCLILSPR